MNVSVQKWGNSLALRIPNSLAKDINVHRGSQVDVIVVDGSMIVNPTKLKKYSLSLLLKGISKSNIHSESDWGTSQGKEVW